MTPATYPLPPWSLSPQKKVLVLTSSPRLDGNSHCLAEALSDGAREAGHDVRLVDLAVHVTGMLRDCRQCRRSDGECGIEDGHAQILRELYLPADAVVFATPIWWYGISAQLKAFIDRIFCYMSESSPHAARSIPALQGKRAALLLAAEESNFSARLGIVQQMAELFRYLNCEFVGIVSGIGNRRGEIGRDPSGPVVEARLLGSRLLEITNTDYRIDTERSKAVWSETPEGYPSHWR